MSIALIRRSLAVAFTGSYTVGASVSTSPVAGRMSFLQVDVPANLALVDAAEAAGVKRFVYTSVLGANEHRGIPYFGAHALVEETGSGRAEALPSGSLGPPDSIPRSPYCCHSPRRAPVPEFGDGRARTNPIQARDLAKLAVEMLQEKGNAERDVGGPEILTRRAASPSARVRRSGFRYACGACPPEWRE